MAVSDRGGGALTQADLQALREQLGREPRGVLAVEARCPAGHPQVIKVYPLLEAGEGGGEEREPFPTLFWLSCPRLAARIARLEHEGWIQRLEAQLRWDEGLRAAYHDDHRRYVKERWETLTPQDRAWVRGRGWEEDFLKRGIGGISDWDRVKCLHLHYAHHRARGSALGRWLEEHCRIRIEPCAGASSGPSSLRPPRPRCR